MDTRSITRTTSTPETSSTTGALLFEEVGKVLSGALLIEVFTLPLVFRPESHLNPGIPQDSSWNLTFRRIVDGILPEWCFIYYVLLVRIESHSIL